MIQQRGIIALVAATLVALGGTQSARAQAYYSGGGYPGWGTYGGTYRTPAYSYGVYPGYVNWNYSGYGYYSGNLAGLGYQWTGTPPRYRADAYTPWELYQYGLPPQPGQYSAGMGTYGTYSAGGYSYPYGGYYGGYYCD